MKIRKHILNALAVLIMTTALLGGAVALHAFAPKAYAEGDKLELVGEPTVYVQSGNEAIFSVQVKNVSGQTLKGVTVAHGFKSYDDYFAEDGEFIDGYSEMTTTDPNYGGTDTWYRFSSYFEKEGYDAVNAVWDSEEEGYTIAAGETATLWFKVWSEYEAPGNYLNGWIVFGDIHSELVGGFYPIPVFDEAYTGHCSIKVVTYNPSAAAITLGTRNSEWGAITQVPLGQAIDLGTKQLNDESALSDEITYYVRNTSEISPTGFDEYGSSQNQYGHSQNIKVDLSVENDENENWRVEYPFGCNSHLNNGMSWAPLEPVTETGGMEAQVGITLNASNYVAGTYNATLKLNTMPHGVKVNGSTIHTNGLYTWPVKVTLTGTNPRIPKAPKSLTASPGNGQVELTWKAGDGAEEGAQYDVYRRVGSETSVNKANLNNAQFDWENYEWIGSDLPDSDGNYLLVDGTVENNKTYTYVIIGDSPLKAYPAITSSVTPKASYNSKLQAPDRAYGNSTVGGVIVEWEMNENYGGSENDGSSMVDHFNIYRDGVLVMQVQQNAVIAEPYYYNVWEPDPEDPETEIQVKKVRFSYGWEAFIETPVPNQNYTWEVAAVSKSGIEGYKSEAVQCQGISDEQVVIDSHTANVYLNWDYPYWDQGDYDTHVEVLSASIGVTLAGDVSAERIEFWRSEGTNPPDTTKAPYRINANAPSAADTYFTDENIKKGKTYTYTVRATGTEGEKSDYYTFRIKVPTGSNWYQEIYSSLYVDWSVVNGRKAQLSWYADEKYDEDGNGYFYGTYKVYRNDAVVKTFTASGQESGEFSYVNDPGSDGTYTYRVDAIINGITIRGRDYTFVRNTAPVDPASLLQVPETPVFDVRISEGNPVLRWAPNSEGSKIEGYHIYRRDAGKLVNGVKSSGYYPTYWNNMRYITIDEPEAGVLIDKYGYYDEDCPDKGYLEGVSWAEEDCPHEYWITAYNAAGESSPSRVVSYDYQGLDENEYPITPSNEDEYPPAAPTITKAWIEWEDDSRAEWDDSIGGRIHVAWEDSAAGIGTIDQWRVLFAVPGDNGSYTLEAWKAAQDPDATKGIGANAPTEYVDAGPDTYGDYGKTVQITVTAENSAGSATSVPYSITVNSLPRFRAMPDNNSVLMQWTDLFNDTDTVVTGWEIKRKGEYGTWQTIASVDKSTHEYRDDEAENGWIYEYQVVAKCDDGIDRPSVVRKVMPTSTSSTEVASAPKNFRAQVVNGEVLFLWDEPEQGRATEYTVMCEYEESNGEKYWASMGSVNAPSTSMASYMNNAGSYRCFVYSRSYINGEWLPDMPYDGSFSEQYPTASNIVPVNITQEDIESQVYDDPESITLSASAGEHSVVLSWSESQGATYYEIERYCHSEPKDPTEFGTITVPATTTSYTDDTALPGFTYYYRVIARNCFTGGVYADVYATPTGRSKDQIAADTVEDLIDGLPDPDDVTIGDANLINEVSDLYGSLTKKQKSLISQAAKDKLAGCIDALEQIQIDDQYSEEIEIVEGLIDAIPADFTLDNLDEAEQKVIAARNAYNALPERARKMVENYSKLTNAEKKIRQLKKAISDQAIVDELLAVLRALESMDQVNADNAQAILDKTADLLSRINNLDADQRALLDAAEDSTDLFENLAQTDNMAKAKLDMDHDHVMQHVEAVDATCSSAGNIEYYRCEACGKLFLDINSETEITEEATAIPMDANAHIWEEWTITEQPSCEEAGSEERYCELCNVKEEQSKPATGHDWEADSDDPESVIDDQGIDAYKVSYHCKNCTANRIGYIYPGGDGSCDINDHVWVEDKTRREYADCTKNGWFYYTCNVCNDTEKREEDIDPLNHDWSEWHNVDEADHTCTEDVVQQKTCSRCGTTETRIKYAEGHKWDAGTVVETADCQHAGSILYRCQKCNETRTEVVPADTTAHVWDEWEVLIEPTCTSEGLRSHTCKNDPSHFESEVMPEIAHDYVAKVTLSATEERIGVRTYTCSHCGDQYTETIAKIVYPTDLPAVKIVKPKVAKKKLTAKWKKVTKKNQKKIGGIEIQVKGPNGYNKYFTAGKSKASKVIKGLASKQNYSVRVRAYKWVGKVKHVSKWTGWKTVKVK